MQIVVNVLSTSCVQRHHEQFKLALQVLISSEVYATTHLQILSYTGSLACTEILAKPCTEYKLFGIKTVFLITRN